jgi:WS/DGAT/MGAT family acyltransferase
MMITGVMILETPLSIDRLKETVEDRVLDRFPRFKQRVVDTGFPLKSPHWEDDPNFSIDSHIHRIALPQPADHDALQDFASSMMSVPLDFNKPPWHYYLIEDYQGGTALFVRLHHCIADGIALMQVLLSMTDNEPDIEVPDPEETVEHPAFGAADSARAAFETTQRVGDAVFGMGRDFIADPSKHLNAATRMGLSGAASLAKLTLLPPDTKTVFKGKLNVQKRAVWSHPLPLANVKAIGKVTGGTVNDVLLTAMAGAFGRYLREEESAAANIRAFVPVNLRPFDKPLEMGNKFGLIILSLPVGIDDTLDRLAELKKRMDRIKGTPEAVVAYSLLSALGMVAQEIEDFGLSFFGTKGSVVMTNVPGPRQQIFLGGSPVNSLMFWVPQSGRMGVGVSIFSYNEQVWIGVATDVGLVPEPVRLVDAFHAEFDEMMQLVDLLNLDLSDPVVDTKVESAPRSNGSVSAESPASTTTRSDLTEIKGIGPRIEEILNAAGIYTFAQLAASDAETVEQILRDAGVRIPAHTASWLQQAALFTGSTG